MSLSLSLLLLLLMTVLLFSFNYQKLLFLQCLEKCFWLCNCFVVDVFVNGILVELTVGIAVLYENDGIAAV